MPRLPAVTSIEYWFRAIRHTYASMRDLLVDLVLAVAAWIVSDVVNYYRAGREAASEASISSAFSGIIPAGLVLVGLFFFRLFLLTPPRLEKLSREGEAVLSSKLASLEKQLLDVRTPQLLLELRQGDNRYLRIVQELGLRRAEQSGHISIENPPGQARSVEDVTVVFSDVIGSKDLMDFRNVRLRIEDQYPSPAITIHPGQKKFVRVISYGEVEGKGPMLMLSHGGMDGKSGGVVHFKPENHYTIKIHVNAKDMVLLSTLVTFGVDNGSLYIRQVQ